MEIVDPFGDNGAIDEPGVTAQRAAEAMIELAAEKLDLVGRRDAIEIGRLIGERDADSRGEEGELREGRIKRAMMYAAWEFDGRPGGNGADYEREFGIGGFSDLRQSVGRSGSDFKSGHEKKKKGD